MSSRVGTAIPASRSTALSSAMVGFTRSIQTAFSGSLSRSVTMAFLSEDSLGTNTENMQNSATGEGRLTKTTCNQEPCSRGLARLGKPFVVAGRPTAIAALQWRKGDGNCPIASLIGGESWIAQVLAAT